MATAISIDDVRGAREAIRGVAVETPLVRSESLSTRAGVPVWLKLETFQPTGAFKIRGAANALARLGPGARARGVVCASTGNHGRAVAHAAARLGVPATVCLSRLVSEHKVKAVEALGARVLRVGDSQDEAGEQVARLVRDQGMTEIPPFDHPHVIAGQGTIGLEVLEQCPDVRTLVVPVSGGGLAGGIALAAKSVDPAVAVVGVSMDRGAAMHASLAAGHPVDVTEVASLADSLGGGIGLDNRHTFDLCRRLLDRVVLLDEAAIYRGMRHLFAHQGLVTEGGAAVGAAALLAGTLALDGPAALIVSGRNVDPEQFLRVARGEPVQLGDLEVGP